MYFHPLGIEAASRHYVQGVIKEPAGYQCACFGERLEVQMREVRIGTLKVELALFDATHATRGSVEPFSLIARGAAMLLAILARAGEKAEQAGFERGGAEPKRVKEQARPIRTDRVSEAASRSVTSHVALRARSQRWLVDPRVG